MAKNNSSQIEVAAEVLSLGIKQLKDLGIKFQSAMGYFWLGEINAEAGRKEMALSYLKKAEGMFQKMGMIHWSSIAKDTLARIQRFSKKKNIS